MSQRKKILGSSNADYWIDACDSVKAKVSLASNLGKASDNQRTFWFVARQEESRPS